MSIANNVLEAIGNTPLVELRRVVTVDHARVMVKLESTNPTGSMKDRMAIAGKSNRGRSWYIDIYIYV